MKTSAQEQLVNHLRSDWRLRGLRWTPERERIVREIFVARRHLDADVLSQRLRRKGISASRATVYRTLAQLAQFGVIQAVFRYGGKVCYERLAEHHDHLLCVACGKAVEFNDSELENGKKRFAACMAS